jgi:hypothetical protein
MRPHVRTASAGQSGPRMHEWPDQIERVHAGHGVLSQIRRRSMSVHLVKERRHAVDVAVDNPERVPSYASSSDVVLPFQDKDALAGFGERGGGDQPMVAGSRREMTS